MAPFDRPAMAAISPVRRQVAVSYENNFGRIQQQFSRLFRPKIILAKF